uniref:Ig-like domain-containing protein n=1 Tax=Fundulus heteroclitus TaxID=8078 RepID=A0A3Q2NVN8_FUNHE
FKIFPTAAVFDLKLAVVFEEKEVVAVTCDPEKIEAFAGGHAILPCSLKNPASDHVPTVEWSKEGLNDSIVFLYRDGCETFGMKNVDFEFRASLFMKEVKNGNVSLRISNLRLSDAGTYQCLIIQRDKTRQTTRVELVVASSSASVSFTASRLVCHLIVGIPYLLSTILLGLIYRDRKRGKATLLSVCAGHLVFLFPLFQLRNFDTF